MNMKLTSLLFGLSTVIAVSGHALGQTYKLRLGHASSAESSQQVALVEFVKLVKDRSKGDIEITVPRAAGFDLDARVERRGTLKAAFPLDETLGSGRERVYEQKVNGGGPRLELSTRNGSIQIRER